jgi:hypothetical protein
MAGGPRAYLGIASAGFPNLFMITGPGSPSVLASMIQAIEQHVDWLADCIGHMRDIGAACIEPIARDEDAWVEHVNDVSTVSLRSTCSSWYVGTNIPGRPRVFMPYIGGFPVYVQKCNEVMSNGFERFCAEGAPAATKRRRCASPNAGGCRSTSRSFRRPRSPQGACRWCEAVAPGSYRVRLDEVESNSGAVRARAEVPFNVPDTAVTASVPAQSTASKQPNIAAGQQLQLAAAAATVLPDGGSPSTVVVPKIATTTVSRGDSLWRLSRLTYGAGTRYAVIYKANREQIRNPNLIHPGQIFVLPAR